MTRSELEDTITSLLLGHVNSDNLEETIRESLVAVYGALLKHSIALCMMGAPETIVKDFSTNLNKDFKSILDKYKATTVLLGKEKPHGTQTH